MAGLRLASTNEPSLSSSMRSGFCSFTWTHRALVVIIIDALPVWTLEGAPASVFLA